MSMNATIECDVKPGAFSDEAVAVIGDRAFIVPRDKVQGEFGPHARLSVTTVEREGVTLAVIPSEYSELVPVTSNVKLFDEV